MLHAKLRNRTCQGLDRQGQGQGQGLTSLQTTSLYIISQSVARPAAVAQRLRDCEVFLPVSELSRMLGATC